MRYFGVLSDANWDTWLCEIPGPTALNSLDSIEQLIPEYQSIEEMCNYEFKRKSYLLQAFTHPSYTGVGVTDSYQKLQFIGDAVLGKWVSASTHPQHVPIK